MHFFSTSIHHISLPSSLTIICDYAFCGCRKLTQVNFPKSSYLQVIEKNAFEGTPIEKITLPSSLTQICEENLKLLRF